MKKVKRNTHDAKLIVATVLICASIAALVLYHVSSVQSAKQQGWLDGSRDTLKQVKTILSK